MRSKALLLILVFSAGVALAGAGNAGGQGSDPAAAGLPRPHNQAAAEEAGRQAGALSAAGPVSAGAAQGPPTLASARVFATQYEPNTPGSFEVAVPDKCVKFAATGLPLSGCSPGYNRGLDYRVLILRDSGQAAIYPVKDVGPWNIDDNYWDYGADAPRPRRLFADLPPGVPEAKAAFESNYNAMPCANLDGTPSGRVDGADQFGRCVLQSAGLDLSLNAAAQLALGPGQNDTLTVVFLWSTLRSNVVSVHTGQNADVRGGSQDDGAEVIEFPNNGGLNQQWRFEQMTADAFRISSVNSGKVMDLLQGSQDNGAPVIQWPWHGGANQLWRVEPVGEGEFQIVSVLSGKVLDLFAGSENPGTPLILWTSHGGSNQRWRLPAIGTG